MDRYTILITDKSGAQILCDPIEANDPRTNVSGWTEISYSLRRNEPGLSSRVVVKPRPDVLAALSVPDARVVVTREPQQPGTSVNHTVIEASGPIEVCTYNYLYTRDKLRGPGEITISFADDLVVLADALVYPDPSKPATEQTTRVRYEINNKLFEDAIRDLVDVSIGPNALPARQHPGLVLGPVNGVLPTTTVSTSFLRNTLLLDALHEVIKLGAGQAEILPLTPLIRVLQGNNQLTFVVEMPPDLSEEIHYAPGLGNVAEFTYQPEAPTGTVAIVGDATAGIGRVIKERVSQEAHDAGWRRREIWVDGRGARNAAELEQIGDNELTETGPKHRLTLRAMPTSRDEAPPLGALVAVEPIDGVVISAVVLGLDVSITRGSEQITPVVGVEGDQIESRQAAEIRRILRRLDRLEGSL